MSREPFALGLLVEDAGVVVQWKQGRWRNEDVCSCGSCGRAGGGESHFIGTGVPMHGYMRMCVRSEAPNG